MNAKTLCTLMGHASISVTYDTYGHLLRGNEAAGHLQPKLPP